MNLLKEIMRTKWQILSSFVDAGYSPKRVMCEFSPEEIYHLCGARRTTSSSAGVPDSEVRPAPDVESSPDVSGERGLFPYDVRYLTPRECSDMIALSNAVRRVKKRRSQPLAESERLWLWDESRRSACLGSDVVARRCSMDDYLYEIYRRLHSRGLELSLDACRHVHHTKTLVATLYRRQLTGQKGDGDVTYFAAPEAPMPSAAGQPATDAMRAFDAAFERLRRRIEVQSRAQNGSADGAN